MPNSFVRSLHDAEQEQWQLKKAYLMRIYLRNLQETGMEPEAPTKSRIQAQFRAKVIQRLRVRALVPI